MLCHLISAIWSVGLSAYAAQMLLHSGALFNVSKSAKQGRDIYQNILGGFLQFSQTL